MDHCIQSCMVRADICSMSPLEAGIGRKIFRIFWRESVGESGRADRRTGRASVHLPFPSVLRPSVRQGGAAASTAAAVGEGISSFF